MKCAIYARVSTDSVDQKDSLENQVTFFENFIQERGWELVKTYADEGITGTSTVKRLNFQRLMSDAEKGQFNIVLIKSISRWARDTVDSINYVRMLQSYKVRIISIEDNFDSAKTDSEMWLTMLSMMAQRESETIARRVSFGIKEKSRKGVFHGTPPYGYDKLKGKLVPNPIHAPNARLIFDLYLKQGWGMQKIANYLTSQGIPTPRQVLGAKNAGYKWQQTAINSILTNPHYSGNLMQGRTKTDIEDKAFNQARGYKRRIQIDEKDWIVIHDSHPAIITLEEFYEVQERIRNNGKRVFRGRGNKSLFARLAFCAECGAGLNFKKDRHGYVCATYQKNGNDRCSSHYIDHQLLKNTIISDLRQLATDSLNLENLFQKALKKMGIKVKGGLDELKQVEREIHKIVVEKRELLRMRTRGDIDQATYEDQYQYINHEYQQLIKRRDNLEQLLHKEKDTENNFRAFQDEISRFIKLDIEDEELLRHVLHKLIDKVEVSANGELTIHYNFKNPLMKGA